MNIAEASINNRVVTLTLTFVLLLGGLTAFQQLSRLEDPEFTIKDALVITPYPGASAAEVEEEVTDELEIAVQQLAQLDQIESRSVGTTVCLTPASSGLSPGSTLCHLMDFPAVSSLEAKRVLS